MRYASASHEPVDTWDGWNRATSDLNANEHTIPAIVSPHAAPWRIRWPGAAPTQRELLVQGRASRHRARLRLLRAGLTVAAGASRAGAAVHVRRDRRGPRRRRGPGLHDAGLARAAHRPGLAAPAAGRDPGDVPRAAGQVRPRGRVGRRGTGQPGPGLPGPEEAERRGEPHQHGDHAGGRAHHGRGHAPAGLRWRAAPVLVGAAVHPGAPRRAVPAGGDLRPGPRAQGSPAAGAGDTGQPGRDGPRGRLDHPGLGLLRPARLAADRRYRGHEPAHPAAVGRGLRAGLGGGLPAHPIPRRDRPPRGRADRRPLAGHAAGVGTGHRAGLEGGPDRR